MQNRSRRLVNFAPAAEMARVVIGDFFQHRFAEFESARLHKIFDVFHTMKNSNLGLCLLRVLPPDSLATSAGNYNFADSSLLNLVEVLPFQPVILPPKTQIISIKAAAFFLVP